jgi:hypothetical protein
MDKQNKTKILKRPGMVAYACNSSSLEGICRRIMDLMSAQQQAQDPT